MVGADRLLQVTKNLDLYSVINSQSEERLKHHGIWSKLQDLWILDSREIQRLKCKN